MWRQKMALWLSRIQPRKPLKTFWVSTMKRILSSRTGHSKNSSRFSTLLRSTRPKSCMTKWIDRSSTFRSPWKMWSRLLPPLKSFPSLTTCLKTFTRGALLSLKNTVLVCHQSWPLSKEMRTKSQWWQFSRTWRQHKSPSNLKMIAPSAKFKILRPASTATRSLVARALASQDLMLLVLVQGSEVFILIFQLRGGRSTEIDSAYW